MMKNIFFALVVVLASALAGSLKKVEKPLQAPTLQNLSSLNDPGFEVSWTRLEKIDDEPVLGYKLKYWEVKGNKTIYWSSVDGEFKPQEKIDEPKIDKYFIPTETEEVVELPGVDNTEAKVAPIKLDTLYEIRVLGYTKNGDGPLSLPMGIKIDSKK